MSPLVGALRVSLAPRLFAGLLLLAFASQSKGLLWASGTASRALGCFLVWRPVRPCILVWRVSLFYPLHGRVPVSSTPRVVFRVSCSVALVARCRSLIGLVSSSFKHGVEGFSPFPGLVPVWAFGPVHMLWSGHNGSQKKPAQEKRPAVRLEAPRASHGSGTEGIETFFSPCKKEPTQRESPADEEGFTGSKTMKTLQETVTGSPTTQKHPGGV